jgi:DNA-binding protein WhiA
MAEVVKDVINSFELDAKVVKRKKYYVVYLKEGSMIVDILNVMEAYVSLMDMENVRIIKDMRNDINRRVNCETANIKKTVSAARRQIDDIEYIEKTKGLKYLNDSLRVLAELRMEEPDANLAELGAMLNPPVSKSGVNHRLRKISSIADSLRETNK